MFYDHLIFIIFTYADYMYKVGADFTLMTVGIGKNI